MPIAKLRHRNLIFTAIFANLIHIRGIFVAAIMIPDFITHYHPLEDPPFQNLSDASDDELPFIIARLSHRRAAGSKRIFGRVYMDYRRQTEAKLKDLFVKAGGRPERSAPHYFVLGTSKWFANLYPEVGDVRFPLSTFPPETISFTYPDSCVSMRLGPNFGLPPDPQRPYHETVFRIIELEKIIGKYGLPRDDADDGAAYADYHLREFERYIEVQVWTDAPIRALLGRSR
ncbi:hypothetical protein G6L94_32625 [Agrobacterium rhizogenes]|nr:hypothetical protein [Rhizobium rhizogenes]OCJ22451.1 hypothetical protein A6U88_29015 [Agrobacterium sp. B131/95]OCJ28560.1 hypothetical protein A6U89_28555 [Agrobacterium sp. B133/95]NTI53063.1 hypothetical protein [Rhizobium rhizogenes]NTI98436.1 hypothetical protein [Rhizobium rhizogenes]